MKKIMILALMMAFVVSQAYAVTDNSPSAVEREHRKEMKKVKDAQREARRNAPPKAKSDENSFWAKEGVRSGFTQTGDGMKNVFTNMNPVPFFKSQEDAYKARKAAQKTPDGVTVKQ
jgi:hypothetical protein